MAMSLKSFLFCPPPPPPRVCVEPKSVLGQRDPVRLLSLRAGQGRAGQGRAGQGSSRPSKVGPVGRPSEAGPVRGLPPPEVEAVSRPGRWVAGV